jgi:hypothetical protein
VNGDPGFDNDSDDDDISLVSRTPSPPIPSTAENLYKYDEYVRGAAREVITVETKIKPSNKGYALLTKLGWKEGQPLGLSGDGTCAVLVIPAILILTKYCNPRSH